jgi:hypothetical protein
MFESSTALRDVVYLDTERVRSLLGQLEGGVVHQVVERTSERRGRDLKASAIKVVEGGLTLGG